jgi:hypothetical protein
LVDNETMRTIWDAADLDAFLDGIIRTELMLRFTLLHPALDATLVGTANVDHLFQNLVVAKHCPLPDDTIAVIKTRFAAAGASAAPR